jgi:hypothetical protein
MVYKFGPGSNRGAASSQHRAICLGLFPSMLNWTQQLQINASQTPEQLRIDPVALFAVFCDQLHLSRIRDNHLMSM